MAKLKMSQEEYEQMLAKLEKSGRVGFGQFAHLFMGIAGAAGGAAAVPAVAGALGIGVGGVAGVVGGVAQYFGYALVATTPIGWIIGGGIAGGALAIGLGKMVHKGGIYSARRQMLKDNILEKIGLLKNESAKKTEDRQFRDVVRILVWPPYKTLFLEKMACIFLRP